MILGEVQRDPNKDTSDENVTQILRKLRKVTVKLQDTVKPQEPNYLAGVSADELFADEDINLDFLIIQLIDTYIPPPVSDVEVLSWLGSSYSTDMIREMGKGAFRIIGEAKKYFGDRDFDTDCLKTAIEEALNG